MEIQDLITEEIKWQEQVIYELELQGEMNTSDAQAVMDAANFLVTQSWFRNVSPAKTAEKILLIS